jgi:hypothetical protein
MRKSILILTLASICAALAAGCMPNGGEGAVAYSPRAYPFLPSIQPIGDSQSAPTALAGGTSK